jgi:hypothetical protein
MDDITMGLKNMLVTLCISFNLCFCFMNNVCFEPLVFELMGAKCVKKLQLVMFEWIYICNDVHSGQDVEKATRDFCGSLGH